MTRQPRKDAAAGKAAVRIHGHKGGTPMVHAPIESPANWAAPALKARTDRPLLDLELSRGPSVLT
jgi:hypothetical protein